ncbi:hypothetical protein [uncultured Tenacibaculum sp.]|uniref:hypothetical protein n=1 Tax=uncultured Tenacibaculum sp. TaxID=174713 RepID=UPI00263071BC|nr:hypothetical protein [uncultured Tenacibaculum sp.]
MGFITILCVLFSRQSSSQKLNEKNSINDLKQHTAFQVPEKLSIPKKILANICKNKKCLVEAFFPIGWSEDENYFAWIIEPENEAIGGYDFTINIQNMKNDTIIWTWPFKEYQQKNWDEKTNYNITKVWNEYKNLISQKLRQYNIRALDKSYNFKTFPAKINNIIYTINSKQTHKFNEGFGYNEIEKESIIIHTTAFGNKTVYEKKNYKWKVINSAIVGCIPSPKKGRIAIIKINEKRGYEGPPNLITPEVIGCHLTKGFK